VLANVTELVFGQSTQAFRLELAFPNKIREDKYERGVLVVILTVILL
jgi:hypothetical protein